MGVELRHISGQAVDPGPDVGTDTERREQLLAERVFLGLQNPIMETLLSRGLRRGRLTVPPAD
ncbi:hypothetical protein Are01nite_10820 [Actinoplanes regularis]|nr:hypothetical protein Are01nite_10820 [Actinoplanes regularis]